MKATYLLIPLGLTMGGCTMYSPPAPVAYVSPPPVAYVSPPSTVVLGSGGTTIDTDGDGYADSVDRAPRDARVN